MDTLDKLVQVSKLELDRRRRELGELEAQRAKLEEQLADLDRRIDGEKAISAAEPTLCPRLGSYIQATRLRQDRIRTAMEELDDRIAAKRERVNEAFREMKRYEKVLANRELERRLAAARREQHRLDEIALRIAAAPARS